MAFKIICNKITKKYDNIIFNEFSYKFNSNGLYILLGPSGCGKTTLLNILCGLTNIDSGQIIIGNKTYDKKVNNDEQLSNIAYITQDNYFVDYLTIYDNLRLCINNDEEIEKLLKKFQLDSIKNQYPKFLSGGEKQRVAIIQALLQKKQILLLDEPTSALDYENKLLVFKLLDMIKDDVLIICATHDETIKEYSDAIIDFNNIDKYYSKTLYQEKCSPITNVNKLETKVNLFKFISKQKLYKDREKKSSIFLILILAICLLTCFMCSNYKTKIYNSLINQYNVNYLTVYCPLTIENYCKDIFSKNKVQDSIYVYKLNVPFSKPKEQNVGDSAISDEINYDGTLETLPFDGNKFPYKDAIKYGTYFTNENQIILGYEKAKAILDNVEELVGQSYEISLPAGKQKFEIVGIFHPFNEKETLYLRSNLGPDSKNESVFLNSKYLTKYLYDDVLGFNETEFNKTAFYVYFNSTYDMKKFHNKFDAEFYEKNSISTVEFESMFVPYVNAIISSQIYLFPALVLTILISLLFYFQTKKIELKYNEHIICVYLYYGYKIKDVKRAMIKFYILDMFKKYIIALVLSLVLAIILNLINSIFSFTQFQLISVDIPSILVVLALLIITTLLICIPLFKKIKIVGWYSILKKRRDLL